MVAAGSFARSMSVFHNQDNPRFLTVNGNLERFKNAVAWVMIYPGILYYGDERPSTALTIERSCGKVWTLTHFYCFSRGMFQQH